MLHWLADRGYVCFDMPLDCSDMFTSALWNSSRNVSSQLGGEGGGGGGAGWGERRLGGGLVRGPVLFSDYVASIEDLSLLYMHARLTLWRDILCFQS